MDFPELAERLAKVRETVADRQHRSGLGHAVRIVAITKTHGADAVRAAARVGLTDVGENRVQEALPKLAHSADAAMRWHLVGGLQRNKVRQIVGVFALIQSVDRIELAVELQRRCPAGTRQPVLVQVNCSAEPQKGGVEPGDLLRLLDALGPLDRLEVQGLMTMAAYDADEALQRRTFASLRGLRDRAEAHGVQLPELSMGMSGDFPAAVEEGATMLRLGTSLFGERTGGEPIIPSGSRS